MSSWFEFVSHSKVETSLAVVFPEEMAFRRGVARFCNTGDHGPSILLSISVSQQENCLFHTSIGSLALFGIKGVDDLRHRQTMTSPADDTKIDSVLDMAIEH
jgi:hypothetical protein